jgi:hypothetical protein
MTMNPQIPHSMINDRITELRQQAAQAATGASRDRGRSRSRAPRLRRRIGLVMIDAGSRMLATTQPVTTE